jgi:hypothetical protein
MVITACFRRRANRGPPGPDKPLAAGPQTAVVGRRDGAMPFLAMVFLSMIMVYNFTGLVERLPRDLYSS